jgi:hypothetical protein
VNNKIEKNIFKFLDITYGDTETFESEKSFAVNGVCVYFKDTKQVGWTGITHLDLVRTFGEGRYYPQLNKWFSEKYNLEVIKTPIFN